MSSFISTFSNRLYTALESQFGIAAAITSASRIPAVQLLAHQAPVPVRRRDKTGSRTSLGLPGGLRTETTFQLRSYLTSWAGNGQPSYGPLFEALTGGTPQIASELQVVTASGTQIQTVTPHGLTKGSAVSFAGEIRFVTSVTDQVTLQTNLPITLTPPAASLLAPSITYKLASILPSISIYDYWDPADAVNRLLTGAAVDEFELIVNGDFHEFTFRGFASDLSDTQTLSAGTGNTSGFPQEPAVAPYDYSIVPGHLGQAWLGNTATRFFSLTSAKIAVSNHIQMRAEEFGASSPLAVVPGPRQVEVGFSVLAYDDAATKALYSAAKMRTPVSAMLQLGQQQGRLMGVYIPAVTPEIPIFDDTQVRLQWQFQNCLAHGVSDDELYLAFA